MYLIAAVDENWAIGCNNKLLYKLPADLQQNFKPKTFGQAVIMGRNTLESLPGKKPLRDRINIVLSRHMPANGDNNLVICRSLAELCAVLPNYPQRRIFVAGGASVYKQLLPYCSLAYITRIMTQKKADKYLADLDKDNRWVLVEKGCDQYHNDGLRFFFSTYKNLNIMPLSGMQANDRGNT